LVGRSRMNYYTFLGYFKYTSTDIPEKMRKKKTNSSSGEAANPPKSHRSTTP
jgi:hypothetical protein